MSNSNVRDDESKNEKIIVVKYVGQNESNNKPKRIGAKTTVKSIENIITYNDEVEEDRTTTEIVTANDKSEATTFASVIPSTKDLATDTTHQDQIKINIEAPSMTAASLINNHSPGETVEQIKEELSKVFKPPSTINKSAKCGEDASMATSQPHYLPPHVTGEMSSGRRISKSRLGVKVPSRNLTSQIVTQDEIAQEIFERSLRKASDALLTRMHNHKVASNKKAVEEPTTTVVVNESPSMNLNPKKNDSVITKLNSDPIAVSAPLKSIAEAASKVNGDSSTSSVLEAGLDHDTLLAILEDTTELTENVNELSSPSNAYILETPVSKTTLIQKNTPPKQPKVTGSILSPSFEKELALKQLMTFDVKKRRGQKPESVRNGVPDDGNNAKLSPPKRAVKRQSCNETNDPSTKSQSREKSAEGDEVNVVKHKLGADKKIPEKPVNKKRKESELSQTDKTESESIAPKPKANSKVMREINRLLGDEGAINMIYSIEQKRCLGERDSNTFASLRRKKKDLLLKTKLVKNAVLRLSMSSSQEQASRTRRISPETNLAQDTIAAAATPVIASLPPPTTTAVSTKPLRSLLRKSSIELTESHSSEPLIPSAKTRKLVAAEASRIIRRHSSSSCYSSDDEASDVAEPHRGSILETNNNEMKKGKLSKSRRQSKDVSSVTAIDSNKRRYNAMVLASDKSYELSNRVPLKEITLRKYDNLVQIIMIPSTTKMKNALNIQILREFISVLRELQKDDKCRAVLVTSTGSSFCQGVDLQTLIHSNQTERVKIVNEFIKMLTDFTICLSKFHKILIAGVHGSAVGLGVTMLPFFDMVFASDKATFYTPYAKLGQIPEAGATITLPRLLGNAVTSELFFGCRMLTASEALQFGLVTRILWPDKFNEELLPLACGIASHSSQSMLTTKKLLKEGRTAKLRDRLETEVELLREQWCSSECQQQFKEYLEQEAFMQNK